MTATERYVLAQKDGAPPARSTAGPAPGDSGISIVRLSFRDGAQVETMAGEHLVWFQMSSSVRLECRMSGRVLRQEAPAGSLAIAPAGADARARADESMEALLVTIRPGELAVAAAADAAFERQLVERLEGFDEALFGAARRLELESAAGYPNGPLGWQELASGFLDGLLSRHTSRPMSEIRGGLGKDVLARLRDHVVAHLDGPVEVAALARLAGLSPFHFSRVFARSVGVTPHRYVVQLRLQRAIELLREGRLSLADIAACTGFADQSHLSRWVRRVHGISPSGLAACYQAGAAG
jgi:AraC family transcriptional regulator